MRMVSPSDFPSSCILDGEMLVWDPVTEKSLPFGTLKTAALSKGGGQAPRPCFKVFDLLFLNGMSVLTHSIAARKANLRLCVKEMAGRVEYSKEMEGRNEKDVMEALKKVMEDRGEGLVIKHLKSQYILNGRTKSWYKVKPEYMDGMGETVDVLVVGENQRASEMTQNRKLIRLTAANFGHGRRGGGVSTLICAVVDDGDSDSDDSDGLRYRSFLRIGTGLSYSDYVWIRAKPWKEWEKDNAPQFLLTSAKGQDDKGDVYLEPEECGIMSYIEHTACSRVFVSVLSL